MSIIKNSTNYNREHCFPVPVNKSTNGSQRQLLKEQQAFLLAMDFPLDHPTSPALVAECSELAVAIGANKPRIAKSIIPKETENLGRPTLLTCSLHDFSGDVRVKLARSLLREG